MPAKENLLGTLHEKVTQAFIDDVTSPERTPATLSAAVKFLKDNGIQCEAGDPEMDKLADKVSNVTAFPFNPKEEVA